MHTSKCSRILPKTSDMRSLMGDLLIARVSSKSKAKTFFILILPLHFSQGYAVDQRYYPFQQLRNKQTAVGKHLSKLASELLSQLKCEQPFLPRLLFHY